MRSKIKIILFMFFGLTLTTCYYDQFVDIGDNSELGDVSFSADVISIFNQSCNTSGCHSGSVVPNLLPEKAFNELINGSYIDVDNPEESELYQWMEGNRSLPMPLTGANASYNATVLAWIEQGALNN